jgi:two-component sensor histidine kinase
MVSYLTRLSHALTTSMIADGRPVTLKVVGEGGTLSSRQAESIGLITTELVMNSLKHAFPRADTKGQIIITYEINGTDWELSVADNGVGKQDGVFAQPKTGLGTGIVKALAQGLNAKVKTLSGLEGTTVSVTHTTFSKADSRVA